MGSSRSSIMKGTEDRTGASLHADTQIRLFQTVPLYVDNLYPYSRAHPFHTVPSPQGTGSAGEQVRREQLAAHLEGNAICSLYTLKSQPDASLQWRLLADRRTLELRPLRWVSDHAATEVDSKEISQSAITSWQFASHLLPTVAISDSVSAHGVARVTVSVCSVDGVVYRLQFGSVWDIADPRLDVAACTAWYQVGLCKDAQSLHIKQPATLEGIGTTMLVVGCEDSTLAWLDLQRVPDDAQGDIHRFVSETVSGAHGILKSVKSLFPRMMHGGHGYDGGANGLVALATTCVLGSNVHCALTLSRDRKLRFWTSGCTSALQHEVQLPRLDLSGNVVNADPQESPARLLDPCIGNYIRIISHSGSSSAIEGGHTSSFSALVFVSDDVASYFAMLHISVDVHGRIAGVQTIMRKLCRDANGTGPLLPEDELVDFQILHHNAAVDDSHGDEAQTHWSLWALWERSQEPLVTFTHLLLRNLGSGDLWYESDPVLGERWYAVISVQKSMRADSDGERIKEIEAQLSRAKDGENQADGADGDLQAAGVSKAFLDHLFNPMRFDRGVLEHALGQYESYASERGFEIPPTALAITASSSQLRQRVHDVIGSFLQVETSKDDGSLLVGEYHRSLFTEWMRYSTLCARIQRVCNMPKALALCRSTNMVCVVGGNTLGFAQAAGKVEWMHALSEGDPAASVLLSAPEHSLAVAYSQLAEGNVRSEIARLLAASSYLAGAMAKDRLSALTDEVAREPSISPLVSYEVRAVELFEKHVASSITAKHARHVGRLLSLCQAPGDTIRLVLQALAQSVETTVSTGAADSLLRSSCTMDGLLVSGFGIANLARVELSRDIVLLLICATYYCDHWRPVQLHRMPELLSTSTKVLNQFVLIQWVASQSLNLPSGAAEDSAADGFLHKFSVLNIGISGDAATSHSAEDDREAGGPGFVYSLLHDIVSRSLSLHFAGRACAFADVVSEGVLQLYAYLGIAGSKDHEVQTRGSLVEFAAKLVGSASAEVADGFMQFLPRSTALSFLSGLVSMRLRDFAAAAEFFANAGVGFAQRTDGIIQCVDLPHVLPAHVLQSGGASSYYRYVADLFEAAHEFAHVSRFCHLSLESLQEESQLEGSDPDDTATCIVRRDLWFKIFHAELECNSHEQTYMAMMAVPDAALRLDCMRHMVGVLCEREGGVAVLCRLGFPGMQEEVERNLLFKARHYDLTGAVNYYKVLYAFHVYRGNYRNAASAMYQYSRRLSLQMMRDGDFASMLVDHGQALLACLNSLQLVDKKYAWVIVGSDGQLGTVPGTTRKRRRISIGRYDTGSNGQDIDIVEIDDIRREYALCMARITLGTIFSDLFVRDVAMEPEDAIALFVKAGMYDSAVAFANTVGQKLDTVLTSLTQKCIEMSAITSPVDQRSAVQEAFWENECVIEAAGTPAERAWRLLQHYLDVQSSQTDRLLVAEVILRSADDAVLPPWLSAPLLQSNAQDLVRLCLRNGCVAEGAEFLLLHIKSSSTRVPSDTAAGKTTRELWLPYQLVDQTLTILGTSVSAFEGAVEKIHDARRRCSLESEEARLRKLLRSYKGRLATLAALMADLNKAFNRYVAMATSESQDLSERLPRTSVRAF